MTKQVLTALHEAAGTPLEDYLCALREQAVGEMANAPTADDRTIGAGKFRMIERILSDIRNAGNCMASIRRDTERPDMKRVF